MIRCLSRASARSGAAIARLPAAAELGIGGAGGRARCSALGVGAADPTGCRTPAQATCNIVEYDSAGKSQKAIAQFAQTEAAPYRYLGFRDLPAIFEKFGLADSAASLRALDYGSGLGYSARMLRSLGMQVVASDVDEKFLRQAQQRIPDADIEFKLIEGGQIGTPGCTFALVFSSFVTSEITSVSGLEAYVDEGARVLKHGGLFIVLSLPNAWIHDDWTCFEIPDIVKNRSAGAGGRVSAVDPASSIEFVDYLYPENVEDAAFSKAGLKLLHKHYPLGRPNEGISWGRELQESPFVISVWQKQ